MATAGRKPLGAGHVDQLSGSARAKLRLATILGTLRSDLKIADACRQLGICQSRFFALRNDWLQESLELLEPRSPGRPSKPPIDSRQAELEQSNSQLQQQLLESEVRRDVEQILAAAGAPATELKPPPAASKKKMRGGPGRRARRRAR